jgi:hypothetical protein
LGAEEIRTFFQEAAFWRLQRKFNHLRAQSLQNSEQLACGIAMALGYKNNSLFFLELFQEYRQRFLSGKLHASDGEALFSEMLGRMGLFLPPHRQRWEKSSYYQQLKQLWEGNEEAKNYSAISLYLNQIRPANHPVRRLAYLAKLCLDDKLHSYWQEAKHGWRTSWRQIFAGKNCSALKNFFLELLPEYKDLYWSCHYTFEPKAQKSSLVFLGKDLRQTIVLNTLLPMLWMEEVDKGDEKEKEAFMHFYAQFSAQASRKSHYLQQRFFGDTEKKKLLSRADLQQGAYQLHHDFCTHYEASCEGCPFVERFQTLYSNS